MMTWLEWIGVISIVVHGTLGFAVTTFLLLDRALRNTEFAKALFQFYSEKCKKERDTITG